MFLPAFQDLIKPQWRLVLEELKRSGSLPVSELSRLLAASYMTVKQHCDELYKLGYLIRTRMPRTAVGRPEIYYGLSTKADELFPQAGVSFTLDLLEEVKQLHGETAPERVFFQYFQRQYDKWVQPLAKFLTTGEKLNKLAAMRSQIGCVSSYKQTEDGLLTLEELHNPLQRVFEKYPRTVLMEQKMLEQLLGVSILRRELKSGREGLPRVIFEIPALARISE